jgi:hypothetical protein
LYKGRLGRATASRSTMPHRAFFLLATEEMVYLAIKFNQKRIESGFKRRCGGCGGRETNNAGMKMVSVYVMRAANSTTPTSFVPPDPLLASSPPIMPPRPL